MAASDYIYGSVMQHLLAALTRPNRLCMELVLATGLRVSDALNLRADTVFSSKTGRITIYESKTGKVRTVYIPKNLLAELRSISGKYYVFSGRSTPTKPRTRQAVYKDLKRAARLFRIPFSLNISPHTGRKIYAVSKYSKKHNTAKAKEILNHGSDDIALLYCLADAITLKQHPNLKQYILP